MGGLLPAGNGTERRVGPAMANALSTYDEVTGFNVLFWGVAFAIVCCLLFANLWSLFTLTDLEADMINPMDACRRLNKMTKLEFAMLVCTPSSAGLPFRLLL